MQTFLPHEDFNKTASCLDYRRLGKQRVEAMQIYNILIGNAKSKAWCNHPAVLMWRGYENSLAFYYNSIRQEWINRGYKNSMPKLDIISHPISPIWLGSENFHNSHRSNLVRKDPIYYGKYNWNVPNHLEYIWPIIK